MPLNLCLIIIFLKVLLGLSLASANEGGHGGAAAAHDSKQESAHEGEPGDDRNLRRITETPDEIQVPSKIWDLLFKDSKAQLTFVPMQLELIEKNPGVLLEPKMQFAFPRGGGAIDLSRVLGKRQGSFYVRFKFETDLSSDTRKVFFVSQARQRRLEGELVGSGCRKFMEIQAGLERADKHGGLLVNTTRFRHLSVIGGSFVFAVNSSSGSQKEVRVSQVSFTDSRHSEYFCNRVSGKDMKNESSQSL
jgi:hypothetical protein